MGRLAPLLAPGVGPRAGLALAALLLVAAAALAGGWQRAAGQDGRRVVEITVGDMHVCALRGSGEIACWGDNEFGQIEAPAVGFRAVSAGDWHSCAIRESGEAVCWGDGRDGQTDAPPGRFAAIGAGGFHTCGVRESGEITCWGLDSFGQPAAAAGRFVAVSAGGFHTCAIRESGELACWGHNWFGETNGPAGGLRNVSAGGAQSCGLRDAGWASWPVCWGERDFGQTDAVNATAAVNLDRGHIVVRRFEDGRTEFAWQPAIGERILPRRRYVPADARVDRWLRSSLIELSGVAIGRIEARLRADGRIESAFRSIGTPTGGERILPTARYLPSAAPHDSWLARQRD